jgi:hypothetical protein
MAFDRALGVPVLFGGGDDESVDYGDTWAWREGTWTRLRPVVSPEGRTHAVMVAGRAGQPFLFGGVRSLFDYLDDTWRLATR